MQFRGVELAHTNRNKAYESIKEILNRIHLYMKSLFFLFYTANVLFLNSELEVSP